MSNIAETEGAFQLPDLDQPALPMRCSKSEHFARTIFSQVLMNVSALKRSYQNVARGQFGPKDHFPRRCHFRSFSGCSVL